MRDHETSLALAPAAPEAGENALSDRLIEDDRTLLRLWLHGRPASTQRAYAGDAERFLEAVGRPLRQINLGDLQAWADSLSGEEATRARKIAAIKSLFTFGQKLGYFRFDTAKPLRQPKLKIKLAERIMPERAVIAMIGLRRENETQNERRDRMILTLFYAAGIRISELCGLKWRDLQDRDNGAGQITVFGKGGKTRTILLTSSELWHDLLELRRDAGDGPVFSSRCKRAISCSQVDRIIKRAAKRAGLSQKISAHWFRHAHGSHAIDHGAPLPLVQQTLGHASIATTGRYLHARPGDSSSRFLPL